MTRIDSETKDNKLDAEKNKQKELCANDKSATNGGERLRKIKAGISTAMRQEWGTSQRTPLGCAFFYEEATTVGDRDKLSKAEGRSTDCGGVSGGRRRPSAFPAHHEDITRHRLRGGGVSCSGKSANTI